MSLPESIKIIATAAPKKLYGELTQQHLLAPYTSWRVGGVAKQFYRPTNKEDLANFIRSLMPEETIVWLGLGSNVLIRDGGISGTVIVTQGRLNELMQLDDCTVYAEAGVSCATLARFCARLGLEGIEFMAGIPGTVGGALAMNAGCFGGETWQRVALVETLDHDGNFHQHTPSDYQIAYRSVKNIHDKKEWFVAGQFQLTIGSKQQAMTKIRALLDHRAATQPTGDPSCGSVFRNPQDDYAGRLIESCGLKGYAIGGARVSEKHANFIVNDGNATAAEIEALINYVASQVSAIHGVTLIKEVHIMGIE